jgi:hypothetical protein
MGVSKCLRDFCQFFVNPVFKISFIHDSWL